MKSINPMNVIDESRIHSMHLWLIFWLFIVIAFDGYDVVIYGAAVPSLIKEWGISDVTAGAIGSYTVIGTAVGAIFFGLLADKIGRKNIILLTTIIFSLFTFLSGFANDPVTFTIFRVIAGIGLGGVMPNVIAIATEFSPKRVRTAIVSFIFCGYSVGAMAAALTSRSLLMTAGWKPVFWLAGLPLLFLPFLMKSIPESVGFLLGKGKIDEAKKVIAKVNPKLSDDATIEFIKPPTKEAGSPVVKLFEEKRAVSTIMFWISCFSAFVLIYSMNTWLPRLMMQSGYDLKSSLSFTAVMQIGAIVGTLIFGPIVDKVGFKKVLVPLFFCGAIALSLIGFANNMFVGFLLISIIGASSVGLQNMSNAFVSQYYPGNMRSTAVGSTMAFGRLGGVVAPTFVGVLLSMHFLPQYNFAAIASAAVIGGIAMLFVKEEHGMYYKEKKEIVSGGSNLTTAK
ncbi:MULTISPECIES: aromatic acid/H+ symport family MFS transporter [unclassified Bacillus (in: firmicutes)]|uniref:MFS transporter n=1 Tax=unclassified Bacillus (in: firmicutes) TaxID=185979 RepID=UPI0023DADE42|nr:MULTISPECIES: aromatic acid/H+ symport family MFS transporter [unclassified Bacillus (in: firmicutes)]MCU4757079.1 aromatic acid/H+ symport family MFS transporter [Bacillus cereus]MDF2021518.1 aromatic acid/H+ symport family MFS transporter [Bacillus sp. Cr_R3]MDF2034852.1 aromatic acid/H+ symport family MFS transporter [Bacillus sp. Cr_R16]